MYSHINTVDSEDFLLEQEFDKSCPEHDSYILLKILEIKKVMKKNFAS